jgi:hypothetical protein
MTSRCKYAFGTGQCQRRTAFSQGGRQMTGARMRKVCTEREKWPARGDSATRQWESRLSSYIIQRIEPELSGADGEEVLRSLDVARESLYLPSGPERMLDVAALGHRCLDKCRAMEAIQDVLVRLSSIASGIVPSDRISARCSTHGRWNSDACRLSNLKSEIASKQREGDAIAIEIRYARFLVETSR